MARENKIELGKLFFEEGLPGFQSLQFFQLLQEDPDSPFFALQSMEDESVSFWVVNPFVFFADYEFTLQESSKQNLKLEGQSPVFVLNVVTVRESGEVTVNLKAPIVVNQEKRMARQVILNDEKYAVRQPLFQLKSAVNE
ncbi:flagellar assembly protein FliW [Brevibacillus migulae]|uniref:flagellar assembly protein FliW n=1 Tax=Brevibacillus migulae TaxID=1644114 RepID=UPI00106DFD62|nr:flagellar assembly protein FliW [Brevibacillus migulae]